MGDNGIQPRFSSKRIDNILTGTFILVVEDCPVQRKFVVNLLSTFPVTAVAVDCAEAAIEVATQHEVDVVLMDVMLPDMPGAELCSKLISTSSGIPPTVIALSACDATQMVRGCYEAGVTDYLRKPLDKVETLLRLQGAIEGRRLKHAQHQADLETRMEMLSLYTASVAHDIGTPLAALSMGLQLLESTNLTSEQQEVMQDLQAAREMMSVVTRKALEHQKALSGLTLQPTLKPTNLGELVSKCARVLRQMSSSSSRVDVSFHIAEDVAEMVVTDGTWMWDCMVNFMSNACKFTSEGTVALSVTQSEKMLWLTVTDTGRGIPEELREKLFKPFVQLQTNAGGTGLGLASIAMQSKALGGACGVSQNEPRGSRFWMSVPYIPTTLPRAPPLESACKAAPDTQGWPVLLIEDTQAVRTLGAKLLSKAGAVVHEAENGLDGLAMMKTQEFAIVLCDMMMPMLDGLLCISKFRCWEAEHRPGRHQLICLLTAQATGDVKEQAMLVGVDYVMDKPIRIQTVLQILKQQ